MNQDQAKELGAYIRRRRAARRVSSEQVASHAGVDPAQILRIERGEVAAPQATVLAAIAEFLRVPLNDLLVLAGYPTSRALPTIEPYLRSKYPRLPLSALRQISEIVNTHSQQGR